MKSLLLNSTAALPEVYSRPEYDNVYDGVIYGAVKINGEFQMKPRKIINVILRYTTAPALFAAVTQRRPAR